MTNILFNLTHPHKASSSDEKTKDKGGSGHQSPQLKLTPHNIYSLILQTYHSGKPLSPTQLNILHLNYHSLSAAFDPVTEYYRIIQKKSLPKT